MSIILSVDTSSKNCSVSLSKDGVLNEQDLLSDDNTTQQYVRIAVHTVLQELGYEIDEEWEMDDNSIELTVTRWVQ